MRAVTATYGNSQLESVRVKDMVRLVFGRLVVQRVQELLRKL